MIFDGKKFASEIKNSLCTEIAALTKKPRLDIVYAGSNPAIENFMKIKIRTGNEVGAETVIHRFPESISQSDLISEIEKIANDECSDGMIVQLPLPAGMNTEEVLNAVPPEKDADVLSTAAFKLFEEGRGNVPPVARAVMEILRKNNVPLVEREVVIVGRGRLVGCPVRICMEKENAHVTVLNSTTGDPTPYLLKADVIVSGTGKAHLIKPEMIKDGVVLIDGGTGQKDGKVAGDADPKCAEKCSFFTPVPGGVGPVMIATLFANLVDLINKKRK